MFEMFEVRFVLRDQPFEKAEHIALYIGIGILVYRQPTGRMLGEKNADTVPVRQMRFDLRSDVDHLLAFRRCCGYEKHMEILPQRR